MPPYNSHSYPLQHEAQMRLAYGILFLLSATLVLAQAPTTPNPGAAATPDVDVSKLAKETQNPVADLVSIPFQFNFNSGGAYVDQTYFNLNIQPVIPIRLNSKVMYISRTILPIVSIPTSNGVSYSGVGDIQEQTFFTAANSGKLILGIGPAFSFPTATAYPAKTGTWAGGGSIVLLAQPGPFVLGSLFTQLSPMHDSGGEPKVNNFLWQYFINYNFGKGWTITLQPSITANWDIHSGQQWTVPYGGGISRTLVFNKQPMSIGFQYYYAPVRPSNAAATTVRFNIALLFPQRPAGK
jgi:hypothetical protein